MYAAEMGNVEIVKHLCGMGAKADLVDEDGCTATQLASYCDDERAFLYLKENCPVKECGVDASFSLCNGSKSENVGGTAIYPPGLDEEEDDWNNPPVDYSDAKLSENPASSIQPSSDIDEFDPLKVAESSKDGNGGGRSNFQTSSHCKPTGTDMQQTGDSAWNVLLDLSDLYKFPDHNKHKTSGSVESSHEEIATSTALLARDIVHTELPPISTNCSTDLKSDRSTEDELNLLMVPLCEDSLKGFKTMPSLETLLEKAMLSSAYPIFYKHEITIHHFLKLRNHRLKELGFTSRQMRNALLNCISVFIEHNKELIKNTEIFKPRYADARRLGSYEPEEVLEEVSRRCTQLRRKVLFCPAFST